MGRKVIRRRLVRYSLLGINVVLLAGVIWFVAHDPQSKIAVTSPATVDAQENNMATNPLDQLSSADIAVNVSRLANLPETTAVTNQAQTENAEQAIIQSSASLVSKPQIVATVFKSNKDIKTYLAKKGDSVASIAAKFGVTSDSIQWSNDLSGNSVSPGQKLYIPPVNGIVYIVKPGDKPGSLAQFYHSNAQQIIAYNDAEIGGLKPGERIIIPNGQLESSGAATYSSNSFTSGFPWGTGPLYNGNGYDYGFCTWYVATQISVPSNWGNASSWSYYAALSGWNVSSRPAAGAVAQTPYAAGGEGHVAIVDAVNASGTMIKYRDMNGLAGWGAVGYSGWVPVSTFANYISP
jgi:surface antigen